MQHKRIVIKVGTNVITRNNGKLNITSISHLVDQLAQLKQQNIEVILVSSGAVGAGRSMMEVPQNMSKIVRRQVLSAIGQVRLMEIYRQLFANQQLFCAQVLATKEDFRDRQHYLNMKACFHALIRDKIIPIVNENDVVAVDELMFTDNDELAGYIAAMCNAEALIILSSVDGVLTGAPDIPDSKVIPEIDPLDEENLKFILPTRSSFGRGGMHTKFRIAQKAAKVGISTYIANGSRQNILLDILNGNYIGTRFKPQQNVSNVKKWMAYSEEEEKGKVIINEGAAKAIRDMEKVSSLLPVGVTKIEGDFQKGDLILILSEAGKTIGYGLAQYDATTAKTYLGQQGHKALIHYDYLFVET